MYTVVDSRYRGGGSFKVMNPEKQKYSEDEQYKIASKEERRTRSDAELIKDGAEYKVNEDGEKVLEVTPEQKYIIDKYSDYGDKEKITEFIAELRRKAAKGPDNLETIMKFGGRDKKIKKVRFTLKNGGAVVGNISDLNVEGWMEDIYLSCGKKPEDKVRMGEIKYYQFVP